MRMNEERDDERLVNGNNSLIKAAKKNNPINASNLCEIHRLLKLRYSISKKYWIDFLPSFDFNLQMEMVNEQTWNSAKKNQSFSDLLRTNHFNWLSLIKMPNVVDLMQQKNPLFQLYELNKQILLPKKSFSSKPSFQIRLLSMIKW